MNKFEKWVRKDHKFAKWVEKGYNPAMGNSKLIVCKDSAPSRVMIQCRTLVNKDAVRRETIDGVEHIIVSSATLPDDVVMNGGLYPADEIAKSFESLELTLAPIEHPTINGQFISASDPRAIHGFHAGAFNQNVRREGGRVHIDKYINVSEALKTDRGKRLIDRIEELESNAEARPIHTSVGVFLAPEELSEPQTNAEGDEFTWIARDMVFDHDAILLDSSGAAKPSQGVGVAVNSQGDEFRVDAIDLDGDKEDVNIISNQSFSDVHKAVGEALERSAINADWIDELFEDRVIFWSSDQLFEVPFVIDEQGLATIVGIPLPVERTVTFTPKTNNQEGNAMKELILNALEEAGVEAEGLSDSELFDAYSQLQANQSNGDDKGIADIVANAVKDATAPLVEQIGGLEAKLNSADEAETVRLAELVGNSDKFPGLDVDAAKNLDVDTLKSMAANCASAFGVSPVINGESALDAFKAPAEMPA